jgi:iron(III) transport system ATP-binding protein
VEVSVDPASPVVASFVGHVALLPALATAGTASTALGPMSVRGARDGRVVVAIRPEQVAVTGSHDPGCLLGEVVDVSFFGHDATVRVLVLGTADAVQLIARVPSEGVPQRGDRVGVRIVGEVVAFPEDRR